MYSFPPIFRHCMLIRASFWPATVFFRELYPAAEGLKSPRFLSGSDDHLLVFKLTQAFLVQILQVCFLFYCINWFKSFSYSLVLLIQHIWREGLPSLFHNNRFWPYPLIPYLHQFLSSLLNVREFFFYPELLLQTVFPSACVRTFHIHNIIFLPTNGTLASQACLCVEIPWRWVRKWESCLCVTFKVSVHDSCQCRWQLNFSSQYSLTLGKW